MRGYFIANLGFLTLTAPWIFLFVGRSTTVWGLPLWAVYTVAAAAGYAVFIALCIAKYWREDERP